jgi:hypothetical protein
MGWFARTERGFALGIRQMALPLGGAPASLTLPSLIDARGPDAASSPAGLSLVAAVVVLMRRRRRPAGAAGAPAPPPTRDWHLAASTPAARCWVRPGDARLHRALPARRPRRGAATAAAALGVLQIVGALVRIVAAGARTARAAHRAHAPHRRPQRRPAGRRRRRLATGPGVFLTRRWPWPPSRP